MMLPSFLLQKEKTAFRSSEKSALQHRENSAFRVTEKNPFRTPAKTSYHAQKRRFGDFLSRNLLAYRVDSLCGLQSKSSWINDCESVDSNCVQVALWM
jgi:hypothetical protein